MTVTSVFSVLLPNNKVKILSFLSFGENSDFIISKLSPTIQLKRPKVATKVETCCP